LSASTSAGAQIEEQLVKAQDTELSVVLGRLQATDTGRITRLLAEELEWWHRMLKLERYAQRREEIEEQLGKSQYKALGVVLSRPPRTQPSEDSSEVSSIKASKRKKVELPSMQPILEESPGHSPRN
jgi:hypothetical protein